MILCEWFGELKNFPRKVKIQGQDTSTVFTFYKKKVVKIGRVLTLDWPLSKFILLLLLVNTINSHIITEANRHDKILATFYFLSVIITGISYCVKPIGLNVINLAIYNASMNYDMPMQSAFLYDITKSPAYEITYTIFCYATYVTALINVSWGVTL